MNVEDARFVYRAAASIAWASMPADSWWLYLEAASIRLDMATAAQFAEFRPDPRLTTPPKDVAS